jgi:hypothetical protein
MLEAQASDTEANNVQPLEEQNDTHMQEEQVAHIDARFKYT